MIVLTLASEDVENEDVFLNPINIVGVLANDEGSTDVVCLDQTVFMVKETPLQVFNLINNKVN